MKKPFTTKNTLTAVALILTFAGASVFTVTKANAQSSDTTTSPMSALVQKLATRFNLNQTEVQAVFDQDRADKEAEHHKKYEDQLSQYVTDRKITAAQKDLIIAKHKEMKADIETEMESMQTMTPQERKTAMEKKRSDLEAWAKTNNIDLQYVMPVIKFGHHGKGMGGEFKMKFRTDASPIPATQ
ncbi:MAG: hypothetical protein M3Q44_06110 [bacterium]|nr:hypothetical protein [bacterium]